MAATGGGAPARASWTPRSHPTRRRGRPLHHVGASGEGKRWPAAREAGVGGGQCLEVTAKACVAVRGTRTTRSR